VISTSTSLISTSAPPFAVDADRWPDLAVIPRSRVRTAVASRLFRMAVKGLPVRVELPGGRVLGTAQTPVMVVHRPREFFRRLGSGGLIGFGESYMAGDWDCADLTDLLSVLAANIADLVPPALQRMRKFAVRRHPAADQQTRAGARVNISRHYDLSNELFALFLDETMTYSSAMFDDGNSTLADAQRHKIDRLLDLAGVGPGCRLLEIGTGWGELAIRAARRGASVLTVTISAQQHALATQRVAEAGLASQVRVELCDYRDITGQFDAICSVEMIEAVGERYWGTFFSAIDRLLAPGGRIGLQAITMPHDRMLATRHTYTWIQKYIFPGGLLPSVTAIQDSLAATTLRITGRHDFGWHYAQTLAMWQDKFDANADEVARLGFDEVFRRMWTFYLCYCEAGFRSRYIDVTQLTLGRI